MTTPQLPERPTTRRPVLEGVLLGLVVFTASAICVASLYVRGRSAEVEAVRSRLERTAAEMATRVDGELHATLRHPEQQDTPEYARALAPLVEFHRSHPEIFYAYTAILDGEAVRFVLDTANAREALHRDRPLEPSHLMDVYEDADPAMVTALRSQVVGSSPEPFADEFGTFISGFAPVRDSAGRVVAIAGVDLELSDFVQQMASMRRAAGFSLAVALLIATGAGAGLAWARHHAGVREQLWRKTTGALRETEVMLHTVLDNADEAICVLDLQGRQLWSNRAFSAVHAAIGATSAGTELITHVHPDDRAAVEAALARAAGSGRSGAFSYRVTLPGAGELHFEAHVSRIADSAGRPAQLVCIARDVTQRKAAEHDRDAARLLLEQSHKLESVGRLAAGVAHEINTPTQFVADNLRFLQSSFGDLDDLLDHLLRFVEDAAGCTRLAGDVAAVTAATQRIELPFLRTEIPKCIEQAIDGVQRVTAIVQALKRFAQPALVEKTAFDLNAAVETTLVVARNEWKRVADARVDLDRTLGPVPCVAGEINQVLLNLIVNAAQAIEEKYGASSGGKGEITVVTRALDHWAEIRVSDTGAGIPAAVQRRVFEPFFTTKPVGKGIGQGLAFARTVVVEKHGGHLTFETTPGAGTCFIVRLPREPNLAAAGVSENGARPQSAATERVDASARLSNAA